MGRKNYYVGCMVLCLLLSIVIKPVILVSAEDIDNDIYYEIGYGDTIYNTQDLFSIYEENSITYQRNMMYYQIQELTGLIADESYDSTNSQYVDVLQKITELNEAKEVLINYRNLLIAEEEALYDTVEEEDLEKDVSDTDTTSIIAEIDAQIASIDLQLLQYKSNKGTLEMNLAEAKLQEDIADFYSDYNLLITKEAKNKLNNEFLKSCYSLIIYKEQLDYYKSYQNYLSLVSEANNIKFGLGLITQLTLDTNISNKLKNSIATMENQNIYNAIFQSIKNNSSIPDNTRIRLNLVNNKKQYGEETVISKFISNNTGYLQLENYVRSYQNYIGSAGTRSYSSYRQTELRISDYKLQIDELKNNIRTYVAKAIKSYELAFQSMETNQRELLVNDEICNTIKTKLEHGRASRIQLQQAIYEKEAVEVKYYQSCYEVVVWQDILDNNIYDATP